MPSPHNPQEIIAVVDDKDNIVGKSPRGNHAEGKLHRETSVLIINRNGEILIQERADNGKIDYSASGHFSYNETYLEGAVREVKEELGIDIPPSKFKEIVKHRIDYSGRYINNRFITLWVVKGNYEIKDLRIDPLEVKSVSYMSKAKLKLIIENEKDRVSNGFAQMFDLYIKKGK